MLCSLNVFTAVILYVLVPVARKVLMFLESKLQSKIHNSVNTHIFILAQQSEHFCSSHTDSHFTSWLH